MAANNPRKFEEKIAQHKLRQAQETKEFEKIMEEMSFVNAKAHTQRQTRGRYGGSLPDFNLAQSQSARHENLNDLAVRHNMDIQAPLKDRPYHPRNRIMTTNRRHNMDTTAPYHHFSPYLSPPQMDANWRRTSSDSSIYHNVTNPNGNRKMSSSPDSTREVGSFLAPKDNELEEMKLNMPNSSQQQQSFNYSSSNNGSLPDLSNLHIPSPLSVSIDQDEQQQYNQTFSAGNSNVFMNRQPRRNTTGSSCKRQVYRHHPVPNLDHLQMPGSYMFQPSSNNCPSPTSPTVAPMYQAPMSPLANGPGYLQYSGQLGSGSLQQQLEQMATIAENMNSKPTIAEVNATNGQMGQGVPPQSPNTFLNMLTQNPSAMENIRQKFQDCISNMDSSENNSLAADIGNAIGGFDGMRGYPGMEPNVGEFPSGLTLEPLDIRDIEVLTGQAVARPEVEAEFRREGNQQQLMQ